MAIDADLNTVEIPCESGVIKFDWTRVAPLASQHPLAFSTLNAACSRSRSWAHWQQHSAWKCQIGRLQIQYFVITQSHGRFLILL